MTIRSASAADAEAITAIYAPIVAMTSISFELAPPSVDEMGSRVEKTLQDVPWLVSEDAQSRVDGYVYAGKHRQIPAYQWSVDVTAYVREDARGQGVAKRLYEALVRELAGLAEGLDRQSGGRDRTDSRLADTDISHRTRTQHGSACNDPTGID